MLKTFAIGNVGAVIEPNPRLVERTKLRQKIDRIWRGQLDVYEYAVVTFIFDRTIGWGEPFEAIKLREFENGRKNTFSGTGISRRKLIDVLNTLSDRLILFRTGDKKSPYRYALNVDWLPE